MWHFFNVGKCGDIRACCHRATCCPTEARERWRYSPSVWNLGWHLLTEGAKKMSRTRAGFVLALAVLGQNIVLGQDETPEQESLPAWSNQAETAFVGWGGPGATTVFSNYCEDKRLHHCCADVWAGYCQERQCWHPLCKPHSDCGSCDTCHSCETCGPQGYGMNQRSTVVRMHESEHVVPAKPEIQVKDVVPNEWELQDNPTSPPQMRTRPVSAAVGSTAKTVRPWANTKR